MKRLAAIASIVGCSYARAARADDAAGADVLFAQAKSLMDQERAAEACPKFEASYDLEQRLGTLLNWADCLEKTKHLVEAEARFREARDLAVRTSNPRSEYAEKRRASLPARFAKLRLDVKVGAEKLQLSKDGARVEESSYGLFEPANPLKIEIVVKRDDEVLETHSIELEEGAESTLQLDLIAISKAHPKKSNVVLRVPQGQRIAGFLVGGVGVAGLIGFGVLEGLAYAKRGEALENGRCAYDSGADAYVCTPVGYALQQASGDLAEAGQWTGIASTVVVAIGVTLLATAPRGVVEEKPKSKGSVVLPVATVDPTQFFVGLRGRLE